MGLSDYLPHSSTNWCYVTWEGAGPEDYMKINVNYADENFLRTYGMTIVEGRDFSEGMRNGTENVVILNETAAGKITGDLRRSQRHGPEGKRPGRNIPFLDLQTVKVY